LKHITDCFKYHVLLSKQTFFIIDGFRIVITEAKRLEEFR